MCLSVYVSAQTLCNRVHTVPAAGDMVQEQSGSQPLCMKPSLDCHQNDMLTGVITTKPTRVQQMMCILHHGFQ